jgi:hypothetical protein
MIRKVIAGLVACLAFGALPALAQGTGPTTTVPDTPAPNQAPPNQATPDNATPEATDGRFVFHRVQDSFVRLDSRTGQVSLCSRRTVGWTCQVAPDDRNVLEGEISRLRNDNAVLKKELLARGLPLPGGLKGAPPTAGDESKSLKLPTEADMERVMTFIEKAWRRLVEMIENLQKDVMKKT